MDRKSWEAFDNQGKRDYTRGVSFLEACLEGAGVSEIPLSGGRSAVHDAPHDI